MEKDRTAKVLAVLALVVATVGISIGFAAFDSVLTISPNATVTPSDETFKVQFSSESGSIKDDTPVTGEATGSSGASAEGATINNDSDSGPTITNLKANFTEPGQTVTYTFYVGNVGEYDAYLKQVDFANVAEEKLASTDFTGQKAEKFCIAGTDTNKGQVEAACDDITIKISIGEAESAATTQDLTSDTSVSSHMLEKNDYEKVVVTIAYSKVGDGHRADGDFTVEFGDITLTYSAAE